MKIATLLLGVLCLALSEPGNAQDATAPPSVTAPTPVLTFFSGTLASLARNQAVLNQAGSSAKLLVDDRLARALQPWLSKRVVLYSLDGIHASSMGPFKESVRGTVVTLTSTGAVYRLANGETRLVLLTAAAMASMRLLPGTPILVTTADGARTESVKSLGRHPLKFDSRKFARPKSP